MADAEARERALAYFCSHDGYHPGNRGNWCELGCGRDYNHMIAVPQRHIDKLLAASEARVAALEQRAEAAEGALRESERRVADLESALKQSERYEATARRENVRHGGLT